MIQAEICTFIISSQPRNSKYTSRLQSTHPQRCNLGFGLVQMGLSLFQSTHTIDFLFLPNHVICTHRNVKAARLQQNIASQSIKMSFHCVSPRIIIVLQKLTQYLSSASLPIRSNSLFTTSNICLCPADAKTCTFSAE